MAAIKIEHGGVKSSMKLQNKYNRYKKVCSIHAFLTRLAQFYGETLRHVKKVKRILNGCLRANRKLNAVVK